LLTSRLNIIAIVVLALARAAAGQQGFDFGMGLTYGLGRAESLEYRVADADIVVLGSIRGGAPARGASVTVEVLEAFKGSASSQVTAVYMPEEARALPARLARSNAQELIFLKRVYVPDRQQTSPELVVRSYVRLDESSGVYSSDFTHLTDTDEILAATRRAIASGDSTEKKTAVLMFPPQPRGAGAKPTPSYLAVPVDARLEALGRKWAEARDPQARVRAARALS
jgi:hypothetical protein